jgi:hypothetical protein
MGNNSNINQQDSSVRENVLDKLLDELYYLANEANDLRCEFFFAKDRVMELLSIIANPDVSNQFRGNDRKEMGPFLNRLHSFLTVISESDDIHQTIKDYVNENY